MTNKNSEESNEYFIPGTEVSEWPGGLYLVPAKVAKSCGYHSDCTSYFIFELHVGSNSERQKYQDAQWCIRLLQERYPDLVPIIKKFFENYPDLALEI